MPRSPDEREFRARDGAWYRACLSHVHPQTGWVIPGRKWLSFVGRDGTYAGAIPVGDAWTMTGISTEKLEAMLRDARGMAGGRAKSVSSEQRDE